MERTLYPFKLVTDVEALNLTVLRVPVAMWPPDHPIETAPARFEDLDFAIEWDEDRDERIIPAVRSALYEGLLPAHVCFASERKGNLTIVVDLERHAGNQPLPHGSLAGYQRALNRLAERWADPWNIEVIPVGGRYRQLADLLKLGAAIRDGDRGHDHKLLVPAPSSGRLQP